MSKIDVDKLTITPALFGVYEHLPPEMIRKFFQQLLELLTEKESEPIYRRAMNICAWVRFSRANFYNGKDQFKKLMTMDDISFENELIPEAIFLRYWELAKREKLWAQKYQLASTFPMTMPLASGWKNMRTRFKPAARTCKYG